MAVGNTLDYRTPGVRTEPPKKRPTPRRRRINATVTGLFFVIFAIGWNVMAWTAAIEMAKAGKYTEISGPGGHPIGTVSVKSDPMGFWFQVSLFPTVGAGFLMGIVYIALRKRRSRQRAMLRLERRRNARSFSRLLPAMPL